MKARPVGARGVLCSSVHGGQNFTRQGISPNIPEKGNKIRSLADA
jgi:hypothetical protein